MARETPTVAEQQGLWSKTSGLEQVVSPGILINVDRVRENLDAMVAMVAGDTARLRPHVKTHKMPALVQMQVERGIDKFKAATIVEAAMVADNGGKDVLLAYQPVGPNQTRLLQLVTRFPKTSFAAIVDDAKIAAELSDAFSAAGATLRLFIDIDCGMHRTGIPLGAGLRNLRCQLESLPAIQYAGLHVYDGHLHQPSLEERQESASGILDAMVDYDSAAPSPTIIGGGSPTFSYWAEHSHYECSPGTTVFWDGGYGGDYKDLPFSIAVAILTRVISKPGSNRLCLDLGYKAVASEMPLESRVTIPAIPDAKLLGHSEEHLVLETNSANTIPVGDTFLAFPRHVCPTIALHDYVSVVKDDVVTGELWLVTARGRKIP